MNMPEVEIQGETSSTEAELNAKISEELGLPTVETDESNATETTTETDTDTTTTEDDSEEQGAEETSTDESADEEEVAEPEEVAPKEPATPSDEELFIEVIDADGVTHKISKIEDLPADFEMRNNRQGLEILRDLGKLDEKRENLEEERAKDEAEAAKVESQNRQLASWDKEVVELSKQKRIDVKDTDKIDGVFKLMTEINETRAKAGNPNRITSFEDALDKFEAQEAKTAAESDEKRENDKAKVKSSLIGRSSSSSKGEAPVYVAGSYRSIDDIPL
jgi:hypothetical protein